MNKFRTIALCLTALVLVPLAALVQQHKELNKAGSVDVHQQIQPADKAAKSGEFFEETSFIRPAIQRVSTEVKTVPYELSFPTAASIAECTIIDANNDNTTFKWENQMGGRLRISYSSSLDMDDWVVTSGIQLEAGKMYKVTVGTQTVDSGLERFDVRIGTAPTAEAMTTTIIGMTEFNSGSKNIKDFSETFSVPTDGVYYIGYHGCSLKDQYYLHLNYVKVVADATGGAPNPVSDFNVTIGANNGLQADITMTAPTTTKLGQPLSSLDKVELSRNGTVIHTFTGITPGQKLSYSDIVEAEGSYTYSAVPYAGNEVGSEAQSTVYLLPDITLPYNEYFSTQANFAKYTVIDNNHDGKVWEWYKTNTDEYVRMPFSRNMAMDDWLITPRMWFETGKTYNFHVETASTHSECIEKFEVKMGKAPTVEAMTTELIPVTNHQGQSFKSHEKEFTVNETGWYNIGVHACSDVDTYYLMVDNILVSAGVENTLPGDIEYLSVTSDPTGGHVATISFKVPDVNYAGQPISSIDKVEVLCYEDVIKTYQNPTPGDTITMTYDNGDNYGQLMYSVIAYNGSGAGNKKTTFAWVGATYPAVVENLTMSETDTFGMVNASWDAVTTTYNGSPFKDPDHITYKVTNYLDDNEPTVANGIKATTWTAQAVEEGKQDFVWYGFYAVSERGASRRVTTSPVLVVGTPYTLPYIESYANAKTSHIIGTIRTAGSTAAWGVAKDNTFKGITSSDGDNGFIYMYTQEINGSSMFFTGKIDLTKVVNPGLSFSTYNIGSSTDESVRDINKIRIYIKEVDSDSWGKPIVETTVDAIGKGIQNAWGKYTTSLAAHKGKLVQIGIEAVSTQFYYTLLDNVQIVEMPEHNLVADDIVAPKRVTPNEPFDVEVTVLNFGVATASGISLELYKTVMNEDSTYSNTLISRAENLEIQSGKSLTHKFPITLTPCDEAEHTYFAQVVHASDLVEEDNKTVTTTVNLNLSTLPAPKNLEASTSSSNKPLLTWTAPDLDDVPDAITEDFEDWTPFLSDKQQHGWTMIDGDGVHLGTIQNMTLPINIGAFFVFDKEKAGGNNTFYGYNQSNHFLASLYRTDDGLTDDWAVSPELSGRAQKIHFYAKSYSGQYPEKMQVFYSTSVPEKDAMTACSEIYTLPNTWQEIEVELPAGAKYFAIRSSSLGAFMLMVDDVTYEPLVAASPKFKSNALSVNGYNIYRDRNKINESPVTETRYEDLTAAQSHVYRVTAVLGDGRETAASDPVSYTATSSVETTGINETYVGVSGRNIKISGADDKRVVISNTSGIVIYNAIGDATIPVEPGIYLVNVAGKTSKLAVK